MTGFADDPNLALLTHETDLLLETVKRFDDAAVRSASRCPGWSRGHVLTHIARNADGLRNVLQTALTGSPGGMYESQERRVTDIEAGAGRSASELESDLEVSDDELLDALADATSDLLEVRVPRLATPVEGDASHQVLIPVRRVPTMRLQEVVFHHVDLDAGYTFADTAPVFVAAELADSARRFRDAAPLVLDAGHEGLWRYGEGHPDGQESGSSTDSRPVVTVTGSAPDLLAWVSGRSDGAGLRSSTGSLPALPAWG